MMSTQGEAPASCREQQPTLVDCTHPEQQNPKALRDRLTHFSEGRQCCAKSMEGFLRVVQTLAGEASHMTVPQLTSIPPFHDVFRSSIKCFADTSMNMTLCAC